MKKRLIIVPKGKKAEDDLDSDQASAADLIELELNEREFEHLWAKEIFELISIKGNSNIDDFEDDAVTGKENLVCVIEALTAIDRSTNLQEAHLIGRIIGLFCEALKWETGVYFFF